MGELVELETMVTVKVVFFHQRSSAKAACVNRQNRELVSTGRRCVRVKGDERLAEEKRDTARMKCDYKTGCGGLGGAGR